MDQFEALKVEIERLNRELAQTSSEKIQSAQYGLVLLDEKEELQKKFDELETLYETTKKDLEQLRDAFMKSQNIQKESASSGIEQEERLLQENAFKEANFTSILQELQKEIKSIKNELEREQAEKERLAIENTDLIKQVEIIDWEKKNLKSELKDLKMRETRLFNDNNELEEENISLQKQISMLKCSQIDFESSKHEVRTLKEEIQAIQMQLEEVENLKKIAERQVISWIELIGFTLIFYVCRCKRRLKLYNRKENKSMQ